jgi:ribonuclease G
MGKELIISANRHETKVAVLEDDQLVEIYFQRANEYSLAGSIHKGRVTRVLPGMQSAFVDIGLDRDAFLYVSDFFEDNEEYDRIAGAAEEKVLRGEKGAVALERVPAAQPVAPAAAASMPVSEEAEGRDRKGRRSRRRRARGRGFPESKYAAGIGVSRHEAVEQPAEPERAEPGDEEFAVLPGETLAKYRHGDDDRIPQEEEAAPAEGVAVPEQSEPLSEPEPPAEDAEQLTEDEVAAQDPSLAMGPPTAEEPAPEEEAPTELSAPEPLLEGPVANGDVSGLEGEAAAEPEADLDNGEISLVTELPDAAIPEEAPPETGERPEESAGPAPAEEIEPARMPVSLTATLREQGYRYPHRLSRRMRRKARGGTFPEAAEERSETGEAPETEPAPNGKANGQARQERSVERPPQPSISELLKEGQEILVQIAKEPLGQKGARITSHIALPGRYVVYMPTVEHLGVSRKIASDEERLRLKRILQNHRTGVPGGYIVRTAGEGKSEDEIASDMRFLFNLWLDIRQKAEARKAPALIHHDLDLVSRILRDQVSEHFKTIWVDSEEIYESVLRFVERFQPNAVSRVKMYTRDTPIFDAFNISSELEKALRPKVWLKSGGYIVINQTEALVAIDVNTGKFVGKSNRLEDTIVKTNTEAVKEIVRQVRLRDLGGIIVVDFIDMDERKNRQKVMQALEEAMRADRAPNKILQFNDFGLVAITRKRVKQSLERTLCSPCPYCEGAGYVKSVQTVIGEIIQEAHKVARAIEGSDVTLRVNPDVARLLKASDNNYLEELEEVLGKPVLVVSDAALQQEKFDLI